ncbi:MAG: MmgE/PrpD family protein [Gammaproteobacteria bacterium]|nr:MmgE/PrpD family protein [Gammaproteobacteria bacterium]
MTAVTRDLSEFVAAATIVTLPREVVERTRLLLMDHVAIALRARHAADLNPAMLAGLERLGLGRGEASVIGDGHGYSPAAAAFYNGNLAHSLDFDDTHARGSIHPSAPIVPAAMAAAEMIGADGNELIAGVVAGYEVQIRLSLALNPTEHYKRGFHPTATCGVFGAAAAAARVFGLTPEQVANAFGLCGSQAAGSMQFLVDGAWNKPYHTGWAAMGGLVAATMAAEGFRGAVEAIEGRAGFLRAYAPNPDFEAAVAGLGETYETMDIAVKPYPSCRYGHAAMDALIELRAANDIDFHDIESVEVGLPRTGWNLIGDPEDEKQHPENYVDGQFSMPFVAAVALREGRMGWDDYAKHLADDDTLALCKRIRTVVDPKAEAEFPAHMSGIARVHTGAGKFEKLVVVAKGEPENFLSDAEMRGKFDDLVSPYLDEAHRERLAKTLLGMNGDTDVRELLALTRAQRDAKLKVAGGDD